jgi:uncharacterized repeat protein (TIGR03806 family)
MRAHIVAALALASCTTTVPEGTTSGDAWDGDAVPFEAALQPSTRPSPPPGVPPVLSATDAYPGQPMTWTIEDLDPNETVYLGRSLGGLGSGPCPPIAGGACLDIANPVVLQGITTADASGVATFDLTVPATAPLGMSVAFQAMAIRGPGGADTVKSNPILVTVQDLADTGAPVGLPGRPANTTCLPPDRPATSASLQLTRRYSGVGFNVPTTLVQPPGNGNFWYVGEQGGAIKRFANTSSVSSTSTVLDISGPVFSGGSELGLLSIAFHPDFANNGEMYVYYTAGNFFSQTSRISRFTSNNGGASFPANSEEILLEVSQPASNHNGGHLLFGPDGYLYFGFGDGGSANDPWNNSQNTNNVLGTMIRIDVDNGAPYGIPSDNPFASGGGAPEIFAWGLRNPYRWSFDRITGEMWVADVGQDRQEEISIVELGGNYGWRVMEGTFCANPGGFGCSAPEYIEPVHSYSHGGGQRSVIGGYVYRGSAIPSLFGAYVFAEFYDGSIRGLFLDSATQQWESDTVATRSGLQTASFAEAQSGELYVLDYAGRIYQLEEATPPSTVFPATLSATGCMDPADVGEPGPALIGYEPNSQLWSDDLDKRRWFALPDGTTVDVESDGDLDFPIGTVIFKEFSWQGQRIETRMMVHHDDGDWGAYDYVWNEAQTDAFLATNGAEVDLGGQIWEIPSQDSCMTCHTSAAGRTLGLEVAQLNHDFDYDGTTANQMRTLDDIGLFSQAQPAPGLLPLYPSLTDVATDEEKVRSYLHANCSMCHRPGGGGLGDTDMRFTTSLSASGLCEAPTNGDFGVSNPAIVQPGAPFSSLLYLRMLSLDDPRMPPSGSNVVHGAATGLVSDWITNLQSCP